MSRVFLFAKQLLNVVFLKQLKLMGKVPAHNLDAPGSNSRFTIEVLLLVLAPAILWRVR